MLSLASDTMLLLHAPSEPISHDWEVQYQLHNHSISGFRYCISRSHEGYDCLATSLCLSFFSRQMDKNRFYALKHELSCRKNESSQKLLQYSKALSPKPAHMYGFMTIQVSSPKVIHKPFSQCSNASLSRCCRSQSPLHQFDLRFSVIQNINKATSSSLPNSKLIPGFKSTPKSDEMRFKRWEEFHGNPSATSGKTRKKNPNKNTRSPLNKLSQHLINPHKDSWGATDPGNLCVYNSVDAVTHKYRRSHHKVCADIRLYVLPWFSWANSSHVHVLRD